MPIIIESRSQAESVLGAAAWFVPDGTTYGDGQTSSRVNKPTFEEARTAGKYLGEVSKWKPEITYTELTKLGASIENQRYATRKRRLIDQCAVLFSSMDRVPEAAAAEWGMAEMPSVGESAKPFSNASGQVRGWLYMEYWDSLRTHGEDGAQGEVCVRGDLGLADIPEHTNQLDTYNWRLDVTDVPADGFTNTGLDITI